MKSIVKQLSTLALVPLLATSAIEAKEVAEESEEAFRWRNNELKNEFDFIKIFFDLHIFGPNLFKIIFISGDQHHSKSKSF